MNEVSGEQHEPSYYEIALTNRQVMVAFIILLLCVLGAFFSGVWVGRGGNNPRQAANAQGAQSTASAQPMQELQFFSGKPASPKPSESPAGTLAADLQKKPETETPAPPEPAPTATVTPASAPLATTSEPAPARAATTTSTAPAPAPSPVAPLRPVPQASATVKPASNGTGKPTAAAATPAPAPSSSVPSANPAASSTAKPAPAKTSELAPGEMVVQVFSSSDGEQAKKMLARVNKGGFKAYLSPLQVGTQTMYRVRIGPFTDRAQAQKVADQVRKKFRLDTWITR